MNKVNEINALLTTDDVLNKEHVRYEYTYFLTKAITDRISSLYKDVSALDNKLSDSELADKVLNALSDEEKLGAKVKDRLLSIKVLSIVFNKPVPKVMAQLGL